MRPLLEKRLYGSHRLEIGHSTSIQYLGALRRPLRGSIQHRDNPFHHQKPTAAILKVHTADFRAKNSRDLQKFLANSADFVLELFQVKM